jgi:hypothetical protein
VSESTSNYTWRRKPEIGNSQSKKPLGGSTTMSSIVSAFYNQEATITSALKYGSEKTIKNSIHRLLQKIY